MNKTIIILKMNYYTFNYNYENISNYKLIIMNL